MYEYLNGGAILARLHHWPCWAPLYSLFHSGRRSRTNIRVVIMVIVCTAAHTVGAVAVALALFVEKARLSKINSRDLAVASARSVSGTADTEPVEAKGPTIASFVLSTADSWRARYRAVLMIRGRKGSLILLAELPLLLVALLLRNPDSSIVVGIGTGIVGISIDDTVDAVSIVVAVDTSANRPNTSKNYRSLQSVGKYVLRIPSASESRVFDGTCVFTASFPNCRKPR